MEIARESKKISPFLWQDCINNLRPNWRSTCPAWSKVLLFEKVESVLRLYKPITLLAARGRPSTMVTAREACRDERHAQSAQPWRLWHCINSIQEAVGHLLLYCTPKIVYTNQKNCSLSAHSKSNFRIQQAYALNLHSTKPSEIKSEVAQMRFRSESALIEICDALC